MSVPPDHSFPQEAELHTALIARCARAVYALRRVKYSLRSRALLASLALNMLRILNICCANVKYRLRRCEIFCSAKCCGEDYKNGFFYTLHSLSHTAQGITPCETAVEQHIPPLGFFPQWGGSSRVAGDGRGKKTILPPALSGHPPPLTRKRTSEAFHSTALCAVRAEAR